MNLKAINNFFSLEKLTIQTFLRIVFIIIIFLFDFLSDIPKNTDIIIIKVSFILITIIISILLVLLLRYYTRKVFLLYLQVFIDLILTTGIIFLIQKTNFLITFLYLLSITNASIILFRMGAFIAAISSTLLTMLVYYLMMSLDILTIDNEIFIKNSIFNLIIYFSYATIITFFTETLAQKDQLIFQKEIELNVEKQIKNSIIDKMYNGVLALNTKKEIIFINIMGLEILDIYDYKNMFIDQLFVNLVDFDINNKQEIEYNDKIIGLTITNLSDEQNDIEGFLIMFKDITEELKLKEIIKNQEGLAYLGKISALIAHEIRNPLASISASLQIIPRFINKDPNKIEKLTAIGLKEINRLNLLITDFLDYARIDKLNLEIINLIDILKEIKELYELKETEYLILKFNDLKEVIIKGDINKFKQIFINLIKNGFEAIENDEKKEIIIECLENQKEYIILVKDSGIGIEEEVIKNIFDPFFTTKKNGTGLGLALVNKFISLHNGRIEINSIVNEGTEFILYLPKIDLNKDKDGNSTKYFNN